jgi:exosome complex component RRP41
MAKGDAPQLLNDDGLRIVDRDPVSDDYTYGRGKDELRPIEIEAGVLNRPDGSALLEWGDNKVLAATYGPRECHPRRDQDPAEAVVRVTYNMAPFSVSDRTRPGPSRRDREIGKVTSEALEPAVLTQLYPGAAIDVFIEIIEAEAGTRCAGLTAASVSMADAGIPMKGLVASCAAGKINDDVVLDLSREEDFHGEADVPIAVVPKTGEVVLLQMDGDLSADEFDDAIDRAYDACYEIHDLQKQALVDRYDGGSTGGSNGGGRR